MFDTLNIVELERVGVVTLFGAPNTPVLKYAKPIKTDWSIYVYDHTSFGQGYFKSLKQYDSNDVPEFNGTGLTVTLAVRKMAGELGWETFEE